jgi:hypothetical protein
VCFGSLNGRYQKCDGMDFILVSLHTGSKFLKKKNLSILKFQKADPRCYYIFLLGFSHYKYIDDNYTKKTLI